MLFRRNDYISPCSMRQAGIAIVILTTGLWASTPAQAQNSADGVTCNGTTACVIDATRQALRVLPRSLTPLFGSPDEVTSPVSDAVFAFKPAYVFERHDIDFDDPTSPKGWYRVGYTPDSAVGWMRARDVFEWRQALLLAYTHPGEGTDRRTPVIMFEDMESASAIARSPDRKARAQGLIADIEAGKQPQGVVAVESARYLNIDEDFYFLPILRWERDPAFDDPAHYLQVFAAVPDERAMMPGEGTLGDPDFDPAGSGNIDTTKLMVDIKFVLDMTGSMQPYIDKVRDTVAGVVDQLPASLADVANVRFGLVGYRDDVSEVPELEWTTRNFTRQLVESPDMLSLLQNGGKPLAANVSSDEWAEDVYAGVNLAIDSAWSSDNSVKFMILVGDASAHAPDASKNTTGLSAETLRARLQASSIYTMTAYLQDQAAMADWPIANAQFSQLGANQGANSFGHAAVPSDKLDNLAVVFDEFVLQISEVVRSAREDGVDGIEKFVEADDPRRLDLPSGSDDTSVQVNTDPVDAEQAEIRAKVTSVIKAALIDYLGNEEKPPLDFVSWVHDYDLADPLTPALGVRVLVTRQELENMIRRVGSLHGAIKNSRMTRLEFFEALKLTAGEASLGLEIDANASFADQDFLPSWIEALPYRSRVLATSPRSFTNMVSADQRQFENEIESKLEYYRTMFNSPDQWVKLDPDDEDMDVVLPLPLTMLP